MVERTNVTNGYLDYDHMVKLRRMDPVKAEAYKKEQRKKYQIKRIRSDIARFQEEYEENIDKNPDQRDYFVEILRKSIAAIPGLHEYEEFKDIGKTVLEQMNDIEESNDMVRQAEKHGKVNSNVSQPGMDELGSEDPETEETDPATAQGEEETAQAIDDRLSEEDPVDVVAEQAPETQPETEETDPATAQGEEETAQAINIDSLRTAYHEKFQKDVPNNKKSDAEWITSKLAE